MVGVESELRREADALCADERLRETVWRHCPYRVDGLERKRLVTAIHANDQMLAHSLRHHRDANAAVSQYFNVALQQYFAGQQLLRGCFEPIPDDFAVLDFACGYGRFLRFLSLGFPPSRIWGAEIQEDAVAYVQSEFGLHGLKTSADPLAFDPGRTFDFIWVASLFSHLPEGLFHGWLSRLYSLLSARGVLCFSVHDEQLLPAELVLPDSGLLFRPVSENPDLEKGIYGTTYVSEAFVVRAIERVAGHGHPYHRIRKGLAHEQDIYVLPRTADADLGGLKSFRRGAWGWVDERRIDSSGQLYLRGWAASLDDGPIEAVEIRVDGRRYRCPTRLIRTDVGRVFQDARLEPSGWEWRLDLGEARGPIYVEVSAESLRGEKALLYAGVLEAPSSPPFLDPTVVDTDNAGWLRRQLDSIRRQFKQFRGS